MTKKKINRAGVIPYYVTEQDNTIHMLFMRPSDPKYGTFYYQIPKGRVEEGESALEAALREGHEETGLFQPNILETYHLGRFLGRTELYVCKVGDPDMFGDPTTPEEVDSTSWMTPEEFQTEGRDLHKPVVKAAVRLIKQKENL